MESFLFFAVLCSAIPACIMYYAIKASITRLMLKRTTKTLNAALQSPELYQIAGAALTAAGVPGGGLIAEGAKSLVGSKPVASDPANVSNNNTINNDNSKNTTSIFNRINGVLGRNTKDTQDIQKDEEFSSKEKSKGSFLGGATRVAAGTALKGAVIGKKVLNRAGREIKNTLNEVDDVMGVSRVINTMKEEAKKQITGVKTFFGSKVYTPSKKFMKEKVWNPIDNKFYVSQRAGMVKYRIKDNINIAKGVARDANAWRKRQIQGIKSTTDLAMNFIKNKSKEIGEEAAKTDVYKKGDKMSQEGLTELTTALKPSIRRQMRLEAAQLKRGKNENSYNDNINNSNMNLAIGDGNLYNEYTKLSQLTEEQIKALQDIGRIKRKKYENRPSRIKGVAKVAAGSALMNGQMVLTGMNYVGKGIATKIDKALDVSGKINNLKQKFNDSRVGTLINKGKQKVKNVRGRIEKATEGTYGRELVKKGKEELEANPISFKRFISKSFSSAKDTIEYALERRDEKALLRAQERFFNASNNIHHIMPKRYVANPPQVIVVNNQQNLKPDVNVKINDTNLNSMYNVMKSNAYVNTNSKYHIQSKFDMPLMRKISKDTNNDSMKPQQKWTFYHAMDRLVKGESENGSTMPKYDMMQKEKFIRNAIMSAPGLTAEQANSVSNEVINKRDQRAKETRSNALMQVYYNRDQKEEVINTIEKLISENPELEENLDSYIKDYYSGTISEERREEILKKAEQIAKGESVQEFENLITEEETKDILNDSKLTTMEMRARAIADKVISKEEQEQINSVKGLFIEKMAEDIRGPITTTVFSSEESQTMLADRLSENDKQAMRKVEETIRAREIKEVNDFISNNPEYKDVPKYEVAEMLKEQQERQDLVEAIEKIAPEVKVDINNTANAESARKSEISIKQDVTVENTQMADQAKNTENEKKKTSKNETPVIENETQNVSEVNKGEGNNQYQTIVVDPVAVENLKAIQKQMQGDKLGKKVERGTNQQDVIIENAQMAGQAKNTENEKKKTNINETPVIENETQNVSEVNNGEGNNQYQTIVVDPVAVENLKEIQKQMQGDKLGKKEERGTNQQNVDTNKNNSTEDPKAKRSQKGSANVNNTADDSKGRKSQRRSSNVNNTTDDSKGKRSQRRSANVNNTADDSKGKRSQIGSASVNNTADNSKSKRSQRESTSVNNTADNSKDRVSQIGSTTINKTPDDSKSRSSKKGKANAKKTTVKDKKIVGVDPAAVANLRFLQNEGRVSTGENTQGRSNRRNK